ncbi:type II toxin-antitoxin system PemK/MazF family toxin [Thiocystis violascens]|uniref:Growth inhibitor n=1 Tax=Thiocystis violascens (strain ATCC 17096 / DSM 198 / 6111) TaxID=765911 RepID=I3YBR3_THIV6|nr:type II toxin-antitoxin system PemK/MazF family toxin [Thiocystis violascens]AFL74431.1 growth inhibitor [Thiocystis violascens DSM 198]
MAYLPNRGDIVHLDFDPSAGREMKGPHFGLVVSGKVFNQQGLAMMCPISQGTAAAARTHGTVVTLMGAGTAIQGAVHCHQLKSLDWRARQVRFKEVAPREIVDDVLARVEAILFDRSA